MTLPTLHQPAIVAALVEDPRLHVSVDGQVQDGRYLQVRSPEETPHVKVNDGVPPAECGRIYFALDHSNKQLIVDHVGLHW